MHAVAVAGRGVGKRASRRQRACPSCAMPSSARSHLTLSTLRLCGGHRATEDAALRRHGEHHHRAGNARRDGRPSGCRADIEAITKAAMRGEIDFEGSLVRRVALFGGLETAKLDPLIERITPMPGAETLVATLRANQCKTALGDRRLHDFRRAGRAAVGLRYRCRKRARS